MKVTCGIALIESSTKSILLCHPTGSPWSVWSIPKGLCNDNESYEEAAIREFKEETGINIGDYNVGLKYVGSYAYDNKKKILVGYYCIVDNPPKLSDLKCSSIVKDLNVPEVDKYTWLNTPWEKIGSNILHHTQFAMLKDIESLFR